MSVKPAAPAVIASHHQRWRVLHELAHWLDGPMAVLGAVWVGLLVLNLTGETNGLFRMLGTAIWAVFVLDFALRLLIAPDRLAYVARNWLTLLSLLAPALRTLRVLRAFRVLRIVGQGGFSLIQVVGSLNRGMNALRSSMRRRGFGYVGALTLVVVLVGAAGMLALEGAPQRGGQGFAGYGDALWWTAMLLTTIGSQYWPMTSDGRILCVLLSLYSISVVGYLTAALATFFVGRDSAKDDGVPRALEALRTEISALRAELAGKARCTCERTAP